MSSTGVGVSTGAYHASTALPVSGNTYQTQPENRAFYPALDGIRAISFVVVFLYHYLQLPWGWAGVDVFFVLSGFLITGILFDTRHDQFRVRNFYIRRSLRIFPLYFGVLLLMAVLYPIFHWAIHWYWAVWLVYLGNWAFLLPAPPHNTMQHVGEFQLVSTTTAHHITLYLGHFWTLCVEEQFYLCWPFIVFVVKDRRRLLQICLWSVPVGLGLRMLFGNKPLSDFVNSQAISHLTIFRLDALLIGGAVALILRGEHRALALTWGRRLAIPCWLIALLYAVSIPLTHPHTGWAATTYAYPRQVLTLGLTAIDLLAALLILAAIQQATWVARILGLRWLRWMGRLSYGLYVFHDIPHQIYGRIASHLLGPSAVGTAAIGFVCTLVIAWASFRFFESPFLNIKDRLTVRG